MQVLLGGAAPDSAAVGLLAPEQLPRWPEAVVPASVPDTATPAPLAPLPSSATQRVQSEEPAGEAAADQAAPLAVAGAGLKVESTAPKQEAPPLQDPGPVAGAATAGMLSQLKAVSKLPPRRHLQKQGCSQHDARPGAQRFARHRSDGPVVRRQSERRMTWPPMPYRSG